MHQLVGRLTARDPEASESLKVIAYFDALVDGRANAEVLLRGAAVLSGCAAGFTALGASRRVDAAGIRSPSDAAEAAASSVTAPGASWQQHSFENGYVWLERTGPAHVNDEMILERFAIALGITLERSAPLTTQHDAVETVIDVSASAAERLAAAALSMPKASKPFGAYSSRP